MTSGAGTATHKGSLAHITAAVILTLIGSIVLSHFMKEKYN